MHNYASGYKALQRGGYFDTCILNLAKEWTRGVKHIITFVFPLNCFSAVAVGLLQWLIIL
jgi:hypothetical protein